MKGVHMLTYGKTKREETKYVGELIEQATKDKMDIQNNPNDAACFADCVRLCKDGQYDEVPDRVLARKLMSLKDPNAKPISLGHVTITHLSKKGVTSVIRGDATQVVAMQADGWSIDKAESVEKFQS
tara:strand:- start:190 stop:570 length:381 start_codon:yes stop_codon:yes gene_type:complete